jgi:hypothetical protein
MLTAEECRKRVQEKLDQAEREPRHRRKLIDAAQAWLLLANGLKRVENCLLPQRPHDAAGRNLVARIRRFGGGVAAKLQHRRGPLLVRRKRLVFIGNVLESFTDTLRDGAIGLTLALSCTLSIHIRC